MHQPSLEYSIEALSDLSALSKKTESAVLVGDRLEFPQMSSFGPFLDYYLQNQDGRWHHTEKLARSTSLRDFYKAAVNWSPSSETFKGKNAFSKILVSEIRRVHGDEIATEAKEQLAKSFAFETAAHLVLPKRFDKASRQQFLVPVSEDEPNNLFHKFNWNFSIFQGQMLWAAINHDVGNKLSISTSTGRIIANNEMSPTYYESPSHSKPFRLVSSRYRSTPQFLMPPIERETIYKLIDSLTRSSLNGRIASRREKDILDDVALKMLHHTNSFADQIAASHSVMINHAIPEEASTQVTIESEELAVKFLVSQLEVEDSILYRTFSSEEIRSEFIKRFAGLETGWKDKNGSCFFQLRKSNAERTRGATRFDEYTGSYDVDTLVSSLKNGEIYPNGVLKFFAFMVEAGTCIVGGTAQCEYGTQLKDIAIQFLTDYFPSEVDRVEALSSMPSDRMLMLPVWGLAHDSDGYRPIDSRDCIFDSPIDMMQFRAIPDVTGFDSVMAAAPVIAQWRHRSAHSPISYEEIINDVIGEEAVVMIDYA